MLSGEHASYPISSITWDRADRIRKVITEEAILEKMESITRLGLIHAIVVTRDGRGVAGETRWNACTRLGWTSIPVQFAEDMSDRELLKIELEENVKRTDLPWQDQCMALLRLHEMNCEDDPEWTYEATGDSAGIAPSTARQQIMVARELEAGNERVTKATEYTVARGITQRQQERRKADELSLIKVTTDKGKPDAESMEVEQPVAPILNVNFLEWIETYTGPSFNLIHCDFPYGINADKFNQGAADAYGGYEDSPETYWALVQGLVRNRERLLGSSGHIIFWYSMQYHHETLLALREAGFWVDPYPLVWHKSDNKGTLPDPTRGPRRVYEVAFLASHGDRKIISAVSNTFSGPTTRIGEHMSEKSEDMLKHFMRMMVDEQTRMLDPTCGSGSALRAAAGLGAGSVLGLEMNPDFAENARRAWDARQV